MFRLICALIAFVIALPAQAQTFDTQARAAYVIDVTSGTVLMEKNADTPLPPASMSKLMTLYVAFEAIADGRLSPDLRLPVSQHAMDYGGSTMFLNTRDRVRVEDLLKGVIVLSGNDASAVLAEALSPDGTEAGFARFMTQRAREMGMMNSTFANSNGWPNPGQRMSVRDLGILAERLILDFPTYYPLFSLQEFAFDGRAPQNSRNRNPLLGLGIGADGLKTGHTQEAGYGLVGSAKQGDRRIVFVITGLDSTAARASESEKIVNWAFRQFALREVVQGGTEIATAQVWNGEAPTVGLAPAQDIALLLPTSTKDKVAAEIVYEGPIAAPIAAGTQLAQLIITRDGLPTQSVPLVATNAVASGGVMKRLGIAAGVALKSVAPHAALPPELGGL